MSEYHALTETLIESPFTDEECLAWARWGAETTLFCEVGHSFGAVYVSGIDEDCYSPFSDERVRYAWVRGTVIEE